MGKAHLVVRAEVRDTADRAAFDHWYATDHLPWAMRVFGARSGWRCWSRTDPGCTTRFTNLPTSTRGGRRPTPRRSCRWLPTSIASGAAGFRGGARSWKWAKRSGRGRLRRHAPRNLRQGLPCGLLPGAADSRERGRLAGRRDVERGHRIARPRAVARRVRGRGAADTVVQAES